jgi:RNA polymerase sigma-70 factor (ECF subfamily)
MRSGSLRVVRSPSLSPTPALENAGLEAIENEHDYVHQTLRRLGAPAGDVEDLALEVFLVLHRSWTDYDSGRPLRPFLFGISYRVASVHRRTCRRRREVEFGSLEVEHGGPGPDDALQKKQAIALVRAALERIPLPRRTAMIMHEIDEVPVDEVARVLGVSRFTVYSRLRKARKELGAALRRLVKDGAAMAWGRS